MGDNKRLFRLIFILLILATLAIWLAVLYSPKKTLKIVACDVGQGDAILAIYGNVQFLFDAGPGSAVLDCIGRHVPFYDKTIELVVITHPQLDHYGGLLYILRSYKVNTILANSLDSSSDSYQALINQVGGLGIDVYQPTGDMIIEYGLIHLDIVHPSKQYLSANTLPKSAETAENVLGTTTSNNDPNDFSIVSILSFGNFDALLTGDIGPNLVDEIIKSGQLKDVEYIKVPHHGSRNGLTQSLLDVSKPEVAVISSGKSNRYGHPHDEVLQMLMQSGASIYRTDARGDVVIESDGKSFFIK